METNANNSNYFRHTHNGTDSPLLETQAITSALNAPQSAMTAASGTLSSGGAGNLSNSDSATLNNALTRIAELEAKLEAMGLITPN